MSKESMHQVKEHFRQKRLKGKRQSKNPESFYYNGNSLLGHDWAIFYMLIASGGIGKSYWVMNHVLSAKFRNPEKVKVFWTRLTDTACGRLLARNADSLTDPDLYRKFGKEYKTRGSKVFYGTHQIRTKTRRDGTKQDIKEWKQEGELLQVYSLSTFFNNKGEAIFDNEFDGDYYVVLDEMNREAGEANRFNIVEAFANQLENFLRTAKCRIRVIMIGNNMSEVSDIMAAFNFVPKGYGRFKLKRRRCIIDVIQPKAEFIELRKQSAGYLLNPEAGRYRDVFEQDNTYVADPSELRTKVPEYVMCFGKSEGEWFTMNKGNLISKYNKETKPQRAMVRYIGKTYDAEFARAIEEAFDNLVFKFDNYATYINFTRKMSLRKK